MERRKSFPGLNELINRPTTNQSVERKDIANGKEFAQRQQRLSTSLPQLENYIPQESLSTVQSSAGKIIYVPIEWIRLEKNIRKTFSRETVEFSQLVESIKDEGIGQNLQAVLKQDDDGNWYLHLIAGQRRLLAAKEAGLTGAPVKILNLESASDEVVRALGENLHRADLHAIDIAEAYNKLRSLGWKTEKIAKRFEKNQETVVRYIKIGRFPDEAREFIRAHADKFSARDLINKFAKRGFASAEELSLALREHASPAKQTKAILSQSISDQLTMIGRKHALRFGLTGTMTKGKVTIKFDDQKELERILHLLNQIPGKKN